MRHHRLAAAIFLTAALPATAAAQDFSWAGNIGGGGSIEIKNVNGRIEAVRAAGGQVRVTAVKQNGERGRAEDIRFETIEHDGGVTICAVYPTPENQRQQNECAPGDEGRMNTRNNDARVEFRVEVPAGVQFVGRNVNGSVAATTLESDIVAETVNGGIEASTTGLIRAKSVNGTVDLVMGRADWRDELAIETVNGAIDITFVGDLNTEVSASTVNGSISSDWPLTVRGRFGPKRVTGTIGSGGRTLALSTVNGSIDLRRR